MSPGDILTLVVALLMLAALPSASVVLVVTRSATGGIRQGIAVACGIVVGDLGFAATALLGLSALAEQLGGLFVLIKLLGGLYLLWYGASLLLARTDASSGIAPPVRCARLMGSFFAGLLLTLGDLKAILFYASLFPLVVPTDRLDGGDILVILAITAVSVGVVKLLYALAARRLDAVIQDRWMRRRAKQGAGLLLLGAGGSLLGNSAFGG